MAETVPLTCSGCGDDFERPHYDVVDAENYYCSQSCRKNIGDHSCPWDGCQYTSDSTLGIKQHHKRSHGVSLTETTTECDWCGEEITRQRSVIEQFEHSFCDKGCKSEWNSQHLSKTRVGEDNPNWQGKSSTDEIEVVCYTCNDEFTRTRWQKQQSDRNFCSRDCYHEALSDDVSGKDNFNWCGGYEPYYGPTWLRQRRKALERDNYECQDCGLGRKGHYNQYDGDLNVHHITPFRTFEDSTDAHQLDNLVTVCKQCHGNREAN